MKLYFTDKFNKCIELIFKDEVVVDNLLNEAFSNKKEFIDIIDKNGKSATINVLKAYSLDRLDMI